MIDLKEFERLVDEALELKFEFLTLWNLIISSYLAMVLKAKG